MAVSRPNIIAAKGFAFPIAASVVAGAATMFVPTPMLESITGATGLSEIFPATAAPLGDTARALIAFSTGALTMAITAIISNRKGPKTMAAPQFKPTFNDSAEYSSPSLAAKLKDRLVDIRKMSLNLPAMPWRKAAATDTVVRDLGDLPKLRTADTHPDAPARRPFSAELDLGSVSTEIEPPAPTPTARFWNDEASPSAEPVIADVAPVQADSVAQDDPVVEITPMAVETIAATKAAEMPAPVVAAAAAAVVSTPSIAVNPAVVDEASSATSLAELVAQLESAVAQRQAFLDRVAATHAEILANPAADTVAVPEIEVANPPVDVASLEAPVAASDGYVPPYFDRPPLEAVPMAAKPDVEVGGEDEALRAALATLRRMNS